MDREGKKGERKQEREKEREKEADSWQRRGSKDDRYRSNTEDLYG